jgi:hypothetical protein
MEPVLLHFINLSSIYAHLSFVAIVAFYFLLITIIPFANFLGILFIIFESLLLLVLWGKVFSPVQEISTS